MYLILILYLISFLIVWQFVGYPLLMAIFATRFKQSDLGIEYKPFVSIIVATYNEAAVIQKRIDNLFSLDYPKAKYEIIVVDSGSSDNTAGIVKNNISQHNSLISNLILIQEATRNGKASAINLGLKSAKGDYVLITDANSFFDKSVLNKLMPHFKDPLVGAVSGKYLISNNNTSITGSESFYWEIESITFLGESLLDSISTVIGTISVWRKELLNFSSDTLSEDLDMTIRVRSKGYKVKYEPSALVYEPAALTAEDQIKQRKRICIGTIQNIFKHLPFFFTSPNFYSLLIFPSHKILPMLSPFFLISIPVLYLIIDNLYIIFFHFFFFSCSFLLLLTGLLFIKSKILVKSNKSSSVFSFKSVPSIVYYVLLNEYLILRAWKDFSSKNYSILWDKATSTR